LALEAERAALVWLQE